MCRNGFYPIIVAPFVTAAFLLDIYSSTGCSFIHVNVGIKPINDAWNETELDIGVFHYNKSGGQGHGSILMDTFHPECQEYDSIFNESFIDGDKTWKVIMFRILDDIVPAIDFFLFSRKICAS